MFYHHHTIRKYTTALLDVFSEIEVPRYNSDGTLLKAINVPISFSSRERAIQLAQKMYLEGGDTTQNILPRMAISLEGMTKASDRDTNKHKKINIQQEVDGSNKLSFQLNSVAYDFSYSLHIMARTMTDLTTIVEQILPLFRPSMNIRIQELDFIEDSMLSIPIYLEGVTFDFPIEAEEDDDIRIVQADLSLTMKGSIHLPVIDTKIIEYIQINFNDIETGGISKLHLEGTPFDDDSITYTKEDIIYD